MALMRHLDFLVISIISKCSTGLRSGEFPGLMGMLMLWSISHVVTLLALWHGALSCFVMLEDLFLMEVKKKNSDVLRELQYKGIAFIDVLLDNT